MRSPRFLAALLPALLLTAPYARGDEPKAESTPAAAETMVAARAREGTFAPPSGFRPRKRGQYVVYCRREEPKGSRFPAEVCYDEAGIREMLQAQREDQRKIDQMRRVNTATSQ